MSKTDKIGKKANTPPIAVYPWLTPRTGFEKLVPVSAEEWEGWCIRLHNGSRPQFPDFHLEVSIVDLRESRNPIYRRVRVVVSDYDDSYMEWESPVFDDTNYEQCLADGLALYNAIGPFITRDELEKMGLGY